MTFIDHLEQLRWHIMRSVIAILVVAIAIFIKIDWIVDNVILGPINNDFVSYKALCDFSHFLRLGDALCMPPIPAEQQLQVTKVGGSFYAAIQIGIIGGIVGAFPFIFWEFWKFVKPALSPKELKYSRNAIFWVSFFFFLGAAFGYFILGPFTFNFLSNFQLGSGKIKYIPAFDDYIDNLVNLVLGCALAFQLPILAYVLTKIGLVTPTFLKRYRKYAYVAILVVSAIITPSPDWTSQMIVFVPLCLLYEFSVMVSKRVFKRDQKANNF